MMLDYCITVGACCPDIFKVSEFFPSGPGLPENPMTFCFGHAFPNVDCRSVNLCNLNAFKIKFGSRGIAFSPQSDTGPHGIPGYCLSVSPSRAWHGSRKPVLEIRD